MSPSLSRLARRLGLDRNPLRRRIDRVQAGLAFLLIAAFLTVAPVAVVVAGHWAHTAGIREERAQQARHRVTAIVVRGTVTGRDRAFAALGTVWARARWTAPDGQVRTGLLRLSAGARAGGSVLVWVNAAGSPAGQPVRPGQWRLRVALAELLTMWGLAIAASLIAVTGRGLLARAPSRRLGEGMAGSWAALESAALTSSGGLPPPDAGAFA